jgi:hypothetical protein
LLRCAIAVMAVGVLGTVREMGCVENDEMAAIKL